MLLYCAFVCLMLCLTRPAAADGIGTGNSAVPRLDVVAASTMLANGSTTKSHGPQAKPKVSSPTIAKVAVDAVAHFADHRDVPQALCLGAVVPHGAIVA